MSVFQEETEMKWKRIALCLAAALCLALCACGGKGLSQKAAPKKEEE